MHLGCVELAEQHGSTRRTCRIVSRRYVTSQEEFELMRVIFSKTILTNFLFSFSFKPLWCRYSLAFFVTADVDECSHGNGVTSSGGGPCGSYSTCLNTVGSYSCRCDDGYYLTDSGLTQRPYCSGLLASSTYDNVIIDVIDVFYLGDIFSFLTFSLGFLVI